MAPLAEMRPKNSQSRIINEKEKQSKVSKLINGKITIVLSIVFIRIRTCCRKRCSSG